MVRTVVAMMFAAMVGTAALAQGPLPSVSVKEAHQQASDGKMVIVDIRTPGEWAETGTPQGAVRLDMTERDFPTKLATLQKQIGDKAVGIICRTANRTSYVQEVLTRHGFKLINIRGGMAGNPGNPGWIASGLPVAR